MESSAPSLQTLDAPGTIRPQGIAFLFKGKEAGEAHLAYDGDSDFSLSTLRSEREALSDPRVISTPGDERLRRDNSRTPNMVVDFALCDCAHEASHGWCLSRLPPGSQIGPNRHDLGDPDYGPLSFPTQGSLSIEAHV